MKCHGNTIMLTCLSAYQRDTSVIVWEYNLITILATYINLM